MREAFLKFNNIFPQIYYCLLHADINLFFPFHLSSVGTFWLIEIGRIPQSQIKDILEQVIRPIKSTEIIIK